MSLKQDEEELIPNFCYACGERQDTIVKMIKSGTVLLKSACKRGNCHNKKCFRFSNLENTPSWKIDITIPETHCHRYIVSKKW